MHGIASVESHGNNRAGKDVVMIRRNDGLMDIWNDAC
jgi:hypothetical protein